MSEIPALPPIKKTHKLNLEKANDRILQNYLSGHDTGNTSIAYRITEKSIDNQVNWLLNLRAHNRL